ncbi:siaz-interacting nuclear protein [Colossoma macropomum]|uniref:siaz-interacting nuclear protein n=1 Tax=Colossoma macropomum TaxID=42526 RepID=UPI0018653FB2|nr:siaz-interacting nuclear protein [Colossoma macropomum]
MAENTSDSPQSGCSEEEKSETNDPCKQKFQWVSRSGHREVAAVRPLPRIGSGSHAAASSSPAGQTSQLARSTPHAAAISPTQLGWRQMDRFSMTQLQPFSFDERDSMQRVAREKRLEELRHMEESRRASATRFRANPVRRYKPLVLRQSTRPLTVPRAPFSRQDL